MPVLSKYTEQNFRAIETLDPFVQSVFREFLWRIAIQGIYIRITDAMRTEEDQWRLYLMGRPWLPGGSQGNPVTWVRGKGSMHTWGLAVDLVVLDRIGPVTYKAIWGGSRYEQIGKIALELGITWGYAKWAVDKPHFHYEGGVQFYDPTVRLRRGEKVIEPQYEHVELPPTMARARDRLRDRGVLV